MGDLLASRHRFLPLRPAALVVWFGFQVSGLGFGVQGLGFIVRDSGFRVWGSGFRVLSVRFMEVYEVV